MSGLLYIHGFASCGRGQKSTALTDYFGQESVDAPDLPPSPTDAISLLEQMIQRNHYDLLVGSSLGGYYATWLAEKFGLKAVLINLSTLPCETLAPYVGWQERFCDGEIFEFKTVYLEQLKRRCRRKGSIWYCFRVKMKCLITIKRKHFTTTIE